MSVEENLRLAQASNKALNDHDVERFLSLHLPSIISRDPQNVEPAKGREAVRAGIEPMFKAFPDFHVVPERSFGQGDWIVEEGVGLGTHNGPLEAPGAPPIPPTNRPVRLPYVLIAKVDGGKFAETHLYFDQMAMLTQLGLTPQGPPQRKP
jgi:predicted ester cyclase